MEHSIRVKEIRLDGPQKLGKEKGEVPAL
jgi:hypothetical protein